MKLKKTLILFIIPLIYLLFSYHPATTSNYVKLEINLDKVPEVYEFADLEIYNKDNNLIDATVINFLNYTYIYNLDPGNYTLKLNYEDQNKEIEFTRIDGFQKLKKTSFASTIFDRDQSLFLYLMLLMSTFFIFITSNLINKEKDPLIRIATISLIIIISLRFGILGLKYYDIDLEEKIYKLSFLFELILGIALLKWTLNRVSFIFSKVLNRIINVFFFMQIGFAILFFFWEFGYLFNIFIHINGINIIALLSIVFIYTREFLFPIISTLIFGLSVFSLVKKRKFSLILSKIGFCLTSFLVATLNWYYTLHDFSNGRIDNVVEIYTFLSVFILILFKVYMHSSSKKYTLLRSTFWWMLRLNYIVFFTYLYAIHIRNVKAAIEVLLVVLVTDILYLILKKSVESQVFTLNKILFKEPNILNLQQLKYLAEKELLEINAIKDVKLFINFDGVSDDTSSTKAINFHGYIQNKNILNLKVYPYEKLNIFEKQAIEEFVEKLPDLALRIHLRETENKEYSMDNYAIGTKLLEIKELILLKNSINKSEDIETIEKNLLSEIDILIREVESHE